MVTAILTACFHEDHRHHSVRERISSLEDSASMRVMDSSYFLTHEKELVEVLNDLKPFYIHERKGQITSYECSECHSTDLEDLQVDPHQRSHWGINLVHADSTTMKCTTCHQAEDMNQLTTLTGDKVDFNESFKVCGQCHSEQLSDWKGGAHGKQVGGWDGPRISFTCVNCHDPHKPAFEPRWPSRYNTQKVIERE